MRFRRLVLLLGALGLISVSGHAGSVTAQEGSQVVVESRFDIADAPSQAEVVQQVVDFPPSAWTSPHSHGGQAINLVLEGEITLRQGGIDKRHTAGQSWTDSTGQVHAAGNTGSGKARLLTNFLLPRGAKQTTVEGTSQRQPSVTYEARFPMPTLPADAEIRQQAIDLEPGWRGSKGYGGFVVSIVMDGDLRFTVNGSEKVYKAGEAWSARAALPVIGENLTSKEARIFTTYLVPKGGSLSVTPGPVDPNISVNTSQPNNPGSVWLWPMLAIALLAAVSAMLGATLLRRNQSR